MQKRAMDGTIRNERGLIPFTWMEGKPVLAHLAQRWRLRLQPDHRVEMEPLITLRP